MPTPARLLAHLSNDPPTAKPTARPAGDVDALLAEMDGLPPDRIEALLAKGNRPV